MTNRVVVERDGTFSAVPIWAAGAQLTVVNVTNFHTMRAIQVKVQLEGEPGYQFGELTSDINREVDRFDIIAACRRLLR